MKEKLTTVLVAPLIILAGVSVMIFTAGVCLFCCVKNCAEWVD